MDIMWLSFTYHAIFTHLVTLVSQRRNQQSTQHTREEVTQKFLQRFNE